MDTILKFSNAIILLLILGLVTWNIFFRRPQMRDALLKEQKEYWESLHFRTDTVKIAIDYDKIPKPVYNYKVPPAQVIQYPEPKPTFIKVTDQDSLIQIIDSLTHEIHYVAKPYLSIYPQANKLLYANFSADTLRIDVLSTEGAIQSLVYPSNFAKFRYKYENNQLTAIGVKRPKSIRPDSYGTLFGYTGYAITKRSAILGLDYSLNMGKFRVGANTFMTIQQTPDFNLNAHVGYRLYGRD